ncbi:CDC27 family protein [Sulfurovum sp.]|uniref:CDC27 family protein n=1 Tax=Sulfurovum sp. TaxID=1969726 RepID=UPI0025E1C5CF|nr:CDC27 family protein [Sulfurovum sp.]
MYDIKPLEEEWKRYNKKKKRPLYLGSAAILFLVILSFAALKYNTADIFKSSEGKNADTVNNTANSQSSSTLRDKALTKLEVKKPKEDIFTETKPVTVVSDNSNPMESAEDTAVLNDEAEIKKPTVKRARTKAVQKRRKKMHLNIIKTTSVSAYKDVEKRFYESHDTDDSLFLARSYYNKGKYKKAEHWAWETNKVNGHIEESWLIFARSKVKLGRKNEAIRVLMSYSKRSGSKKAKNLLLKIKNGAL